MHVVFIDWFVYSMTTYKHEGVEFLIHSHKKNGMEIWTVAIFFNF